MGAHVSVPMYQRGVEQRYALLGLRCNRCGKVNFPPKAACKYCLTGSQFTPVRMSGAGRVYSYTVISGAGAPPEFSDEAAARGSYPVLVVQLDEGPRVIGQAASGYRGSPGIGVPVRVVFRRIYSEDGVVRYGFKFDLLPEAGH